MHRNYRLVLAGDLNAWSVEWESRTNNPKGILAASLGLALANTGIIFTFVTGEATSIIDVTFYRDTTFANWKVLERGSFNDHAYVEFVVDPVPHGPVGTERTTATDTGWLLKKVDLEAPPPPPFFAHAALEAAGNPAIVSIKALNGYLTDAYDASIPLRTQGPARKRPVYWWSDETTDLRKKSFALRRKHQLVLRCFGLDGSQVTRANYSERALRTKIKTSKEIKIWKELCSQVNTDP